MNKEDNELITLKDINMEILKEKRRENKLRALQIEASLYLSGANRKAILNELSEVMRE